VYAIQIGEADGLAAFRDAARRLLAAGIEPAAIAWTEHEETLFAERLPPQEPASAASTTLVPRAFLALADHVACHREVRRWSLLYLALWRIARGERGLAEVVSDPLTHRLHRMAAAVKYDQHRMTAFLRFRRVEDQFGECFIAWYQPQHHILRRTAAFFVDRFASMRFSILTPALTLHWDGASQSFCSGLTRQDAPSDDAVEDDWRRYYSATFNPTRVNPRLMASQMPRRFWRDLPEASAIQDLLSGAAARTDAMVADKVPRGAAQEPP